MLRIAQSAWKTLCCLIAAGSFLAGSLSSDAQDMAEGISFVTSQKGSVHLIDAASQSIETTLHDTLALNGATIETEKDAHIFLALSNGMGVGIEQDSEIQFETFIQRPYPSDKERLSYEPSVSILSIRLIRGSLAVTTNQLSPLSKARIHLSTGELRLHTTTCIIRNDERGDHITACEGTITHYYLNGNEREFIVKPQSISISPQSAKLGKVTQSEMLTTLPESIVSLATATKQASKRVLFKAGQNGGPPYPVLIASPDYFEQTASRPYEFNE